MKKLLALLLTLTLTALFISCEETTDNIVNGDTNSDSAIVLVAAANVSLADVLYDLINSDSISNPDEIDFTEPNQLYKSALLLDSTNLDASFGAGLTEMLMVFVDPQVNSTYDMWEAFIDTATFFEPSPGRLGKSLHSPSELLSVSPLILGAYSSGIFKMSLSDPPLVSSIQDLIENEVLPRVNYAIEKLTAVTANTGYTFTITPHMQGDDTEDAIEIDLTEIYLALTELYAIKSVGYMFISYNFNFVSYDSTGLENAIDQSSSFLGLRSGGSTNMAAAKTSFLTAIDKLEAAINFLQNETDNQNDDLVVIGPDDINQEDVDSLLAHLPDARNMLNSSYDLTADFNDDGVDQTVAISLGALFDDPISNFKQMLPTYTSGVGTDSSINTYWVWDDSLNQYVEETEVEYFYVGVITWEATSFAQWEFPDPTFDGFFPEITTDAEFKSTFGIVAEDWEQEMRIDLFH